MGTKLIHCAHDPHVHLAHHVLHPLAPPHIMQCTHLHFCAPCTAPTRTSAYHVLHPPNIQASCSAPICTSTHQLSHPTLPTLCAAHTCAFMRPNSFQHGPSRFTRASFGLLPPRVPQLTSPAGPPGFAQQRFALSDAPFPCTRHDSSSSLSQVRSTALSYIMRAHVYCPSRRVLDSLPGAKNNNKAVKVI